MRESDVRPSTGGGPPSGAAPSSQMRERTLASSIRGHAIIEVTACAICGSDLTASKHRHRISSLIEHAIDVSDNLVSLRNRVIARPPEILLFPVLLPAQFHEDLKRQPMAKPSKTELPWQNACAERLIGSIRRECIDHVVVFGERHLRHVLLSYMTYYNDARTHLSLYKDAPVPRTIQTSGRVSCQPILGGLHHLYARI